MNVWLRVQLSRLLYAGLRLAKEREQILADLAILKSDIAAGRPERSGPDAYADETAIWRNYEGVFDRGIDGHDTFFRNSYMLAELQKLDGPFVDFGCLYGWIVGHLHKQGETAYGVDRSVEVQHLNQAKFPGASFIASDIQDFLKSTNLAGGTLFHVKTGIFVLPHTLEAVYRLARASGVRAVALFEANGISRVSGRYFKAGDTTIFRGSMLLHDYPALLAKAGFQVTKRAVLKPPHPESDFRSLFILAERI